MSKFRAHRNSFIAGEISPTALGRTDLPQYPHACEKLVNMIPILSGGVYRRPGTQFNSSYAGADYYAPVLKPFISGSDIGMNAPVVIERTTASGVDGGDGDVLALDGYGIRSSGDHEYRIGCINTATLVDEAHDIQFAQSVDVMYLVHPKHKPKKLVRNVTAGIFDCRDFDSSASGSHFAGTKFRDAWPYLEQNSTSITLDPSATTGTITVVASAAFFNAAHVGASFKFYNGAEYGCFQITAVASSTSATALVKVDFASGHAAALTWWESAWSNYRGWPRTVDFFRGRIVFGGTSSYPDTVWCSTTGNYEVMSVDSITLPKSAPTGSQPFTFTLAAQQLGTIQWLSAGDSLFIGTSRNEWIVTDDGAGTFSAALGDCNPSLESSYGSSYHQAIRVGSEIIFCSPSGDELRALFFNERETAYQVEPIQLLFDTYPKTTSRTTASSYSFPAIRSFAWDESRKTIWVNDTSGNFYGCTRDRKLGINAWHTHQFGGFDSTVVGGELGSFGTLTTDPAYYTPTGSVVSFCLTPHLTHGTNNIWFVIKRKVGNTWNWHIEKLEGRNIIFDTIATIIPQYASIYSFVDSSIFELSALATPLTIFGSTNTLAHLNGISLTGTAFNTNGLFKVTTDAVAAGTANMTSYAPGGYTSLDTGVRLGLPFTSYIKPVRLEAGSVIGSAQGALKRIHELTIRFFRTLAANVGSSASDAETLVFREGSTLMGKSAELFTGDKTIKLNSDYDRDGYVYLEQSEPMPFSVISISGEGMTYD